MVSGFNLKSCRALYNDQCRVIAIIIIIVFLNMIITILLDNHLKSSRALSNNLCSMSQSSTCLVLAFCCDHLQEMIIVVIVHIVIVIVAIVAIVAIVVVVVVVIIMFTLALASLAASASAAIAL